MTYTLDVRFKQYVVPLTRILRERYGHNADARDAGTTIELHFPTIARYEKYLYVKQFIDGFVAALEYNA